MESLPRQSSNSRPRIRPAKNRDARRFERKQRISRFFKKTIKSVSVIALIMIVSGIAYTWYMGRNIDTAALQDPVEVEVRKDNGPTKPAENVPVSASIQSLDTPVTPGMNVAMTVRTKPEATCTISFIYNDIASTDSGLTEKVADEYGMVSWSWTVDSSVPLGTWPAKVLCSLGEKSGMVIGNVEVVSVIE